MLSTIVWSSKAVQYDAKLEKYNGLALPCVPLNEIEYNWKLSKLVHKLGVYAPVSTKITAISRVSPTPTFFLKKPNR